VPAIPPADPPDALNAAADFAGLVGRLRAAGCVFAEAEARLLSSAASTGEELETLVERRVAGEPLEYVLGWVRFCGLDIAVDPGVFVPRRRTEFLVRSAVEMTLPHSVVVDLCCGSGAVGIALASRVPFLDVYAADIDPAAVACARTNFTRFSRYLKAAEAVAGAAGAYEARVFEGDLFAPLPGTLRGRVDVLVVNAPYVPSDAIAMMPPEARDHEARVALDGGGDGMDVQRRVAASARDWLASSGRILIETSRIQAPVTAEILAQGGLRSRVVWSKKRDATVVIGSAAPRCAGEAPAAEG